MDSTATYYRDEDEANRELTSILKAQGHQAQYHYYLGNGRTADVFVDGYIIEGKLSPNQSEIDRLIGQALEYTTYNYKVYIVIYGYIKTYFKQRIITELVNRYPDKVFLYYLDFPRRIRKT